MTPALRILTALVTSLLFGFGLAIASLSLGLASAVIFAVAMLIGMVTHDRFLAGKA